MRKKTQAKKSGLKRVEIINEAMSKKDIFLIFLTTFPVNSSI
jgi:hypothetical protein